MKRKENDEKDSTEDNDDDDDDLFGNDEFEYVDDNDSESDSDEFSEEPEEAEETEEAEEPEEFAEPEESKVSELIEGPDEPEEPDEFGSKYEAAPNQLKTDHEPELITLASAAPPTVPSVDLTAAPSPTSTAAPLANLPVASTAAPSPALSPPVAATPAAATAVPPTAPSADLPTIASAASSTASSAAPPTASSAAPPTASTAATPILSSQSQPTDAPHPVRPNSLTAISNDAPGFDMKETEHTLNPTQSPVNSPTDGPKPFNTVTQPSHPLHCTTQVNNASPVGQICLQPSNPRNVPGLELVDTPQPHYPPQLPSTGLSPNAEPPIYQPLNEHFPSAKRSDFHVEIPVYQIKNTPQPVYPSQLSNIAHVTQPFYNQSPSVPQLPIEKSNDLVQSHDNSLIFRNSTRSEKPILDRSSASQSLASTAQGDTNAMNRALPAQNNSVPKCPRTLSQLH